jgi:hypothetical protein
MTATTTTFTAADVRHTHIAALETCSQEQLTALARELLALKIVDAGNAHGVTVTRSEALDEAFVAEAAALNQGYTAKVDFFLPLDKEIPIKTERAN